YLNTPTEVFGFFAWKSVQDGFVGIAIWVLALFLICVGAIACILTPDGSTPAGHFKKWGWTIMWGSGLIMFVIACYFVGTAATRKPATVITGGAKSA
ncbi:MAG TPA: hypothetical protein VM260_16815, partial [Pirellula sp.]|nr:hypothetical protein [Pirellula sp.]